MEIPLYNSNYKSPLKIHVLDSTPILDTYSNMILLQKFTVICNYPWNFFNFLRNMQFCKSIFRNFYYWFHGKIQKGRKKRQRLSVTVCIWGRKLLLGFRERVRYPKENITNSILFFFGYRATGGKCTSVEVVRYGFLWTGINFDKKAKMGILEVEFRK